MKKRLKIVLDCDDVLYECNNEGIKKLNEKYGSEYKLSDIKEWGLTGTLLDKRLEFYDDPKFIRNLPLIEGAKDFVKKLSEKAELFICTAVQPNCASERLASIIENFPEIKVSNIMIGGRKDMISADMMLDDCILNLEKANVTYPVLMQRPWNANGNAGILSVNGYEEFLQLVDTILSTDDTSSYKVCSLIGPPGSGKTKIMEELLKIDSKFEMVPTYTTAKKKAAIYKKVSKDAFEQMQRSGYFSETSTYLGNKYGIVNEDIERILDNNKIPLMMLDVNGAMGVSRYYKTLKCFVDSPKAICIKNILEKELPIDTATERICCLDGELKNKNICDVVISGITPNLEVITDML